MLEVKSDVMRLPDRHGAWQDNLHFHGITLPKVVCPHHIHHHVLVVRTGHLGHLLQEIIRSRVAYKLVELLLRDQGPAPHYVQTDQDSPCQQLDLSRPLAYKISNGKKTVAECMWLSCLSGTREAGLS